MEPERAAAVGGLREHATLRGQVLFRSGREVLRRRMVREDVGPEGRLPQQHSVRRLVDEDEGEPVEVMRSSEVRQVGEPALEPFEHGGVGADGGPAQPSRRLRCVVLEDPRSVALGNEPVRHEGETLGRVTSGGYGYTVQRSIAYAILPTAYAEVGTPAQVEIFGHWVDGEVAREPLFDPRGERIRA